MRLKDKVILVTGSTTGIGEGMVRVFAREGAKVMIHGRRKDAAQALARELGESASFASARSKIRRCLHGSSGKL